MNLSKQQRLERVRAYDQAERASDYGVGNPSDPTGFKKPRNAPPVQGAAAVLRRLRKHGPELHALVLKGELSIYKAAVTAGFRRGKRCYVKKKDRINNAIQSAIVQLPASMINALQEEELWLGPSHRGSAFASEEERRRLWELHRERLLSLFASDGHRPQAFWKYDSPIPFPGLARERSTLWAAGLLGKQEQRSLEAYWREEFNRAMQPNFFYVAGQGEILEGEAARDRLIAWADIPSVLVEQWKCAAAK